jgi:hypothetical protein
MVSGHRAHRGAPAGGADSNYQLRVATEADCDRIYASIGNSLARPKGKTPRKSYVDAARRGELLMLERWDPREQAWHLAGMLEWYTRVDGTVTIKDAGTYGEQPDAAVVKRLVRELIALQAPTELRAKTKDEQKEWARIFAELPGFVLEGKEYSRPHWVYVWSWAPGRSRLTPPGAAGSPARPDVPAGSPGR